MKRMWLELDYYQNLQRKYSEDAALLQLFVERERIFYFFGGLDVRFDQVGSQILGKESFSLSLP